ncbi:hypothetical protein [Novosphingobium aquimarinum]|uniref:hypothetical protein n=1 Tax=Novosphingobium aquimarinum TaxID=2682494 RepID=UPI0012EBA87B|nr:hypothetical protein [Novosphingobium aquimarinum]
MPRVAQSGHAKTEVFRLWAATAAILSIAAIVGSIALDGVRAFWLGHVGGG